MASAILVGLSILLLYSKNSFGQQGLEVQHLGLHIAGNPNSQSCLSKLQSSNALQNGQITQQQAKLQHHNLQQQQQGLQQQQFLQQQQYLQQQQAFQQQQIAQQQALQQPLNAQLSTASNLQLPTKLQNVNIQQPPNTQNLNYPCTVPTTNIQFLKSQKPQVVETSNTFSLKSQPQGSQNTKDPNNSNIPQIQLTSLKFVPVDPNFSQGNPDASLTFQIGSQVHQIPLNSLTQTASTASQNLQSQPQSFVTQNQNIPQIQTVIPQVTTPAPFTLSQSVSQPNSASASMGTSSSVLSPYKNQPSTILQNMMPASYQEVRESMATKFTPFTNYFQNSPCQNSIPNQSVSNPFQMQTLVNQVQNQPSTVSMLNKPVTIFPVTQVPTISPPQQNQLVVLPIDSQTNSVTTPAPMSSFQIIPQMQSLVQTSPIQSLVPSSLQNQQLISSIPLQPAVLSLQNPPTVLANPMQSMFQNSLMSQFQSQPVLTPSQNPYLTMQVQLPQSQSFPPIVPMQSTPFLPVLENQQHLIGVQEPAIAITPSLPILNTQTQPSFPFFFPEYQTIFQSPNGGFNGKPKSSGLKALLPILINILKERSDCRCPHCNGFYDDFEPNMFGGCSNLRKTLPEERSFVPTITSNHEELMRSGRSDLNETEQNVELETENESVEEEEEDSSEYIDDSDDES